MERALREVHGSLLVAVPRELASKRGWRAGDQMSFQETELGILLDRAVPEKNHVYTVGYEGRSIADFLALLGSNRVRRVIDVRERPVSRKPGFSYRQLEKALDVRGIEYVPLRELGSPMSARRAYRAGGSFAAFARRYESHLGTKGPSLTVLRALSSEMPSAILCFEKDWRTCHRSLLAAHLKHEGFSLEHL